MKRSLSPFVVSGLLLGCGTEEPEDGSTTAASSVGMTSGASTAGDETSSGGSETSSGAGGSESGSDSSGGVPVVDYEADVQPIWNGSCTCHLMGESGRMTAPFMTLNPGMSYAELVGVPAEQAALSRIEAGDPEQSYLWLKVNGAHDAVGSGTIMPPIGAIGDAQLATIEAWILGGAEP